MNSDRTFKSAAANWVCNCCMATGFCKSGNRGKVDQKWSGTRTRIARFTVGRPNNLIWSNRACIASRRKTTCLIDYTVSTWSIRVYYIDRPVCLPDLLLLDRLVYSDRIDSLATHPIDLTAWLIDPCMYGLTDTTHDWLELPDWSIQYFPPVCPSISVDWGTRSASAIRFAENFIEISCRKPDCNHRTTEICDVTKQCVTQKT